MEALSINFLIKDSPKAVVVVDTKMCILVHSNLWREDFAPGQSSLIGKSYYEVIPETPAELKKIHENCLKGNSHSSKGTKFINSNSGIHWFKWKINSWRDEEEEVGGLIMVQEDITEDKRREELLMKAESVARIGGWEVDVESGNVYWTEVTKEIHEVPNDFVPSLEEGINFYKAGNSRDEITKLVSEAMVDGVPWDTELQIVTAKGNELWVRARGETEIINGKCTRIYGTFQDINEKKLVSLEYEKVSNRLAVATTAAKIGIWDYNIIENELVWDDNMYILYGVDKKDFSGVYEAWQSGLHPEDKERGEKEITWAIEGKKDFDTDFRVVWPDGSLHHIKARATVQRDENGKAIKIVGANWDITELKTTRLKLTRSEQSFTDAFGKSAIGMAIVDLEGKWIEVNQSLCTSFGFSRKEMLKKTFQEITFPEDAERDSVIMEELITRKKSSYQFEKRFYHKKGHVVYAMLTATSVDDIDGNLSHFICQIVDITTRIEAEKRLQTLVKVTKGQNESLMNFAHIVSHNLRSHSSNMSMLTKFLSQEKNTDEKRNIEEMLCKATNSLNETVEHLNEVVQIKTGALDKMRSVSLCTTLNRVKDNLIALLQEKEATCTFDISKAHFVNVVPAYLDSILLNLFTNSLKYASDKRKPQIEVSSKIKNDFIQVSFSDNGQGIDMERYGKKIFGMYKTFHKHKDAKGIGLFITKNQIESMYGSIKVHSEIDKGTTFTIKFKKG